jgi:predicted acylesterase/phospholipase RssA
MANHIANIPSSTELSQKRISLVLMGGGAKGAYQIGVWKALWELGVRSFASIAGTSVGALNGVLIADKNPQEAEDIWKKVVDAGVLQSTAERWKALRRIFLGYILFLLPVGLGFALLIFKDVIAISTGKTYTVLSVLLGVSIWMFASNLARVAAYGAVIPLALKVDTIKKVGRWLFWCGLLTATVQLRSLASVIRLSLLWLLPTYIAVFWIFAFGFSALRKALECAPAFTRLALDQTVKSLLSNATFPHCSGPVWATIAKFSAYLRPFDVDWRFKREGLFSDIRYDWRFSEQPQRIEWTPYYLDLKAEKDASWVLEASSAIPYAFKAVRQTWGVFVDGGLCDNWPVAPIVSSKPDVIIIVGVNHDFPDGYADIAKTVTSRWETYLFSNEKMNTMIDDLREQWVKESEKNNANNTLSAPAAPPKLIDGFDKIKFIWINPSVATATWIPILHTIRGTMNFTRDYTDRLMRLGYNDTKALFAND